eukprot:403332928
MNQKSDSPDQFQEEERSAFDDDANKPKLSSAQQQLQQYRQMMQERLNKQHNHNDLEKQGAGDEQQDRHLNNNQNYNNTNTTSTPYANSSKFNMISSEQNQQFNQPSAQKANNDLKNTNNQNYKEEINTQGNQIKNSNQDYNPYLHTHGLGKNQQQNTINNFIYDPNMPAPIAALLPPDQIKVQIPVKKLYDFTKRSQNMQLVNEGVFDQFDYTERCDSKIEEGDLQKLEIELKKKQRKRIRQEQRQLIQNTQRAINGSSGSSNNNENRQPIVDEEGNVIRPFDNQQVDQLIGEDGYQPLLNNPVQRREFPERRYLRGMIRQTRQGRYDILCMKDLDKQFIFLFKGRINSAGYQLSGRATDCRSVGRWFNSGMALQFLNFFINLQQIFNQFT